MVLRLFVSVLFLNFILLPVGGQQEKKQSYHEDNSLKLECNNLVIAVDPSKGSRITSFKLDGIEILGTRELHPAFYGSTLWLSPEGKWRGNGLLDNGNYQVNEANDSTIQLTSREDTVRGFIFSKRISRCLTDSSIIIHYKIKNIADHDQEVAAWEVTRVPTGGLAFIPKGLINNNPTKNETYPLLPVIDSIGTIWYRYDTDLKSPEKLFMDGGEGWMAYVRNGIIFIKKIPVIGSGEAAPGEKNIEIYVNMQKTYLEIENQGRYERLGSGEMLDYEVKWYARRIPSYIEPVAGNNLLLEFARSIALRGESISMAK